MAFITLEDRYGEIEVIVFARQYKLFQKEIFTENAVVVEGTLSFEDGDEVRVLLSNLTPLSSNSELDEKVSLSEEKSKISTVYVKVPSVSDPKVSTLTRLALLNPGKSKIVVYDSSKNCYQALKDASISLTDKVILRLKSVFGNDSVVIK